MNVSAPIRDGDGRYRIVADAKGRPAGSVMVHVRPHSSIELTDLRVEPGFRGQGIGQSLVHSAARAAVQLGKTRVSLASQDNGSGRLTKWYKGMGFSQVGINGLGFAELEAPISRLLPAGHTP